jgi:hypothetical protein
MPPEVASASWLVAPIQMLVLPVIAFTLAAAFTVTVRVANESPQVPVLTA